MIDKNNFNPSQPETLVITSVETLKEAFQQWAEEQEQTRLATANDAMLDESAVLQRLGKSVLHFGDGMLRAILHVIRLEARTVISSPMWNA